MNDTMGKITVISLISSTAFVLFEILIGHLFTNILGLHDPYPRSAEFGSILSGWYIRFSAFLFLYFIALLFAFNETKNQHYINSILVGIVLAFLYAVFNRWYYIPRDQSFWVVLLSPLIFVFIAIVSNKAS